MEVYVHGFVCVWVDNREKVRVRVCVCVFNPRKRERVFFSLFFSAVVENENRRE